MAVRSKVKIKKFSRAQVVFHWVYGSSWFLLMLTGMSFLWRPDPGAAAVGLGPLLQGTVGQSFRLVHRVAAIGLMASPLTWLVGDFRSLWPDLKELLRFGINDARYMLIAPLHYTFGKPALPPQGKYNGGHKVNFYVVVLTFIGFVSSGLLMWFGRGAVPDGTFHMAQIVHSTSFWLGAIMTALHIYLTAVHPFTRRALSAMTQGFVELNYAKAEHKVWVEKEIAAGTAVLVEEPGDC
ncbi:MAG: formate dehydrogenase gamma subunit [Symbiobacteriaceae bacterium]|jgi:formate dehydrogenase subunit gamma|nr:formate dehydrogenase gamma subunit [Symbiobacteriaceae bacterium]